MGRHRATHYGPRTVGWGSDSGVPPPQRHFLRGMCVGNMAPSCHPNSPEVLTPDPFIPGRTTSQTHTTTNTCPRTRVHDHLLLTLTPPPGPVTVSLPCMLLSSSGCACHWKCIITSPLPLSPPFSLLQISLHPSTVTRSPFLCAAGFHSGGCHGNSQRSQEGAGVRRLTSIVWLPWSLPPGSITRIIARWSQPKRTEGRRSNQSRDAAQQFQPSTAFNFWLS